MKKLLLLATILLLLVGCTPAGKGDDQGKASSDMEVVKIYKEPYSTLLDENTQSELYSKGLGMEDNEIAILGQKLSSYSFTTSDGQAINLPENSAYVLEIVGSWCGYCQALTSVVVRNGINDRVPVYQYFMYGTPEDIETFYQGAEVEKPDSIVALVENEDFQMWLQQHEFYSVPLTLVVNDTGRISMSHLGYMDAEPYASLINYGLGAKLYDTKVDGVSLAEFIKRQDAVRAYINSLEEIAVPKELLD